MIKYYYGEGIQENSPNCKLTSLQTGITNRSRSHKPRKYNWGDTSSEKKVCSLKSWERSITAHLSALTYDLMVAKSHPTATPIKRPNNHQRTQNELQYIQVKYSYRYVNSNRVKELTNLF